MPVSHASETSVTSPAERAAGEVPGLLELLAQVPDPRAPLRAHLAVAVASALVGGASARPTTPPLTCRRRCLPPLARDRTCCSGGSSRPARRGSGP